MSAPDPTEKGTWTDRREEILTRYATPSTHIAKYTPDQRAEILWALNSTYCMGCGLPWPECDDSDGKCCGAETETVTVERCVKCEMLLVQTARRPTPPEELRGRVAEIVESEVAEVAAMDVPKPAMFAVAERILALIQPTESQKCVECLGQTSEAEDGFCEVAEGAAVVCSRECWERFASRFDGPTEGREDEAFIQGQSCGSYDVHGEIATTVGKMVEMGYDPTPLEVLCEHILGGVDIPPLREDAATILDQRFLDQLNALEEIGYTLTKREHLEELARLRARPVPAEPEGRYIGAHEGRSQMNALLVAMRDGQEVAPHIVAQWPGLQWAARLAVPAEPEGPVATGNERGGWPVWRNVECVECPDCAFFMAAEHVDEADPHGYTCPNCDPAVPAEGERPTPERLRELAKWFDTPANVGSVCWEQAPNNLYTAGFLLRRIADEFEAVLHPEETGV